MGSRSGHGVEGEWDLRSSDRFVVVDTRVFLLCSQSLHGVFFARRLGSGAREAFREGFGFRCFLGDRHGGDGSVRWFRFAIAFLLHQGGDLVRGTARELRGHRLGTVGARGGRQVDRAHHLGQLGGRRWCAMATLGERTLGRGSSRGLRLHPASSSALSGGRKSSSATGTRGTIAPEHLPDGGRRRSPRNRHWLLCRLLGQ